MIKKEREYVNDFKNEHSKDIRLAKIEFEDRLQKLKVELVTSVRQLLLKY